MCVVEYRHIHRPARRLFSLSDTHNKTLAIPLAMFRRPSKWCHQPRHITGPAKVLMHAWRGYVCPYWTESLAPRRVCVCVCVCTYLGMHEYMHARMHVRGDRWLQGREKARVMGEEWR